MQTIKPRDVIILHEHQLPSTMSRRAKLKEIMRSADLTPDSLKARSQAFSDNIEST